MKDYKIHFLSVLLLSCLLLVATGSDVTIATSAAFVSKTTSASSVNLTLDNTLNEGIKRFICTTLFTTTNHS